MSLPVKVESSKHYVKWKDGVPYPVGTYLLSKQNIEDLHLVALSSPYEPDDTLPEDQYWDEKLRYEGMTKGEVMILKLTEKASQGNMHAMSMVLDRILGKPKQSVESKTMTMTYKDYLDHLSNGQFNPGSTNNS